MRSTTIVALIACGLLLVGPACSDEDEDFIGDKCLEKCQITSSHACYKTLISGASAQSVCLNKCKQLAGAADKPPYISGCGMCIADSFDYALKTDPPCDKNPNDPSCCYGPTHKSPNDKECVTKCFEADGGPAY